MSVSREFILAGNATFTIEVNPAEVGQPTGNGSTKAPHYTYRVERSEPTDRYPNPAYFVSVLAGPDNTSDYVYLGVLDPFTGQVRRTKASKFPEDSFRLRLLNRVLARIWSGDHDAYERAGYQTHHEGRCGRCGRKLTVPQSVLSGIGPECAKHGIGGVQ